MASGVEIRKLQWRKARGSESVNQCVEAAPLPGGGTAVRDSKNPSGAVLEFTPGEWTAFTAGVRGGEFDF